VSIDGAAITGIADIVERYEEVDGMKEKPEYVLIEFVRDNKNYVTLIKPRIEDRPDPPAELPKAWVGIATQPVLRNLAEKLGHADQRGFRVMRVYSGTQAAQAGLEVGDVVLSLNGEKLEPRGMQDAGAFNRAVRRLNIDSTATLGVLRDGKVLDLPVTLERTRIEPQEAARARNTDFELAVREITFFDREDYRWDESVSGVLVESSEPAGWAGLAGVRGGDLIQKIGDHEVRDVAGFKRAMEQIGKAQPGRVVFVVFRGSRTYFRFAEPDWKPTTEVEPKE
jgi:serine protease Do